VKKYTINITVLPSDLDELQHVNNIRYLEWVQEISKAHWKAITQNQFNTRFFWVVRRHDMTYLKSAVAGNVLTISTYVPELRGPMSRRIVEFYIAHPDNKIAKCETEWILMDNKTGKPCRIPSEIQELFEG
jgi:acyl-CoA thioester hydrolase